MRKAEFLLAYVAGAWKYLGATKNGCARRSDMRAPFFLAPTTFKFLSHPGQRKPLPSPQEGKSVPRRFSNPILIQPENKNHLL